jgi:hypothetical protein
MSPRSILRAHHSAGKKSMKSFVSRCSGLIAILLFVCVSLPAQQTKHTVIVVLDGVRYSESFGDSTHINIPIIWNQLRPQGTVYTSFRNDGVTMTNSGHASILTGTRESLRNNGTEPPHNPTLFEYFRKQTGAPRSDCWVVLGKTKLQMLTSSSHSAYGGPYGASVKTSTSEYDDRIAESNAISVLADHHPSLMIVNIPAPDEFAHNRFWEKYLFAIRQADTIIGALWDAVRLDPLLRDSTTMIVTNDHGRHTSDYTDHGDSCDGCRHIMLLVLGPETPAGVVDPTPYRQIDIAPTVAALLGFKTPDSVGRTIESASSKLKQKSHR